MNQPAERTAMHGMALLAVLFALTLLALLALPFAVSMTIGADAAMRDVEATSVATSSASVRDLLLADAAMSHPMLDPTPSFDGLDEFPGEVVVPKAFAGMTEGGKVLLGGQVIDLQRYLQLDSASPLLFANTIGTTTRLAKDLGKDDKEIELDDATALPESGYVYIDDELIQYAGKDGSKLTGLRRGQLHPEFKDGKQDVKQGTLVLDYRCVIAAAWPFLGPDPSRQTRRPYRAVGELLAIQSAGFGTFTAAEMDALQRVFTVDTMAATAGTWGRPERIFGDLHPTKEGVNSKVMIVKSALHLGAGSTVRLRNLRTGESEYGLVMAAGTLTAAADLSLPSAFALRLLFRVGRAYPAIDTVVEPLIPAPININTAPREVLAAICEQIRRAPDVRMHEGGGAQAMTPRWLGRAAVASFVDELLMQREPSPQADRGPFKGWEDLVERMWRPRFEEAKSGPDTSLWVQLYRNLQTGRDSTTEMGTAPVCFQSGPWVAYRAAASRSRSLAAAGVAARHERSGVAAAVPGFWLERRWASQDTLEEAFLLDRRAPFWVTTPVNLGALQPLSPGNDPAARYFPHLYAYAFPGAGFGEKRFPVRDEADSGFMPSPATAISGLWQGSRARGFDTFAQTLDPRGHDVKKQGPYRMVNTGPAAGAGNGNGQPTQGQQAQAQTRQAGGRHDQLSFPFANGDSFVERFGIAFWLEPESLTNSVLFDHSDGNPDRNRLSLQVKDGNLLYEVIDAAGIDPDPSQSQAGVERTASEWSVPVAEIGLPANTAMHVNVSATSARPADLSFAIDGMTRGKPKFVTYLTSALKVFDPNLASNQTLPGQGGTRNERYLDLQVESTEGFPPVGCLRIGFELFEYSAIKGNSFQCQWKDSIGGRGARQVGREHRPGIPVDQNGKPTVNLNDPQFQDVNLDVFPEHPAGSMVELYGYSVLPSDDTPLLVGSTKLDGAIGEFSVGRGFITSPRPITIQLGPGQQSEPIGAGIDESWSGDIELADPKPDRQNQTKPAADDICNGFPTSGGYALLVQRRLRWSRSLGAQLSTPTQTGGVELVRYTRRQGNKLSGVQRAQQLPGQDGQIASDEYDGQPRKFVTTYENRQVLINGQLYFADEIPTWILFVVPVSLPVQNASVLWDPQKTGFSEWAQLFPKGSDNDTEWVRYDVLDSQKHLVRANRAAWEATRFALTRSIGTLQIENGAGSMAGDPLTPPWGTLTPTSGFIGYTTQFESTWPQIHAARQGLRFRGDPFTGTSSHKHDNSDVMACQRLQLLWGNYGACTGRVGRFDRVAIVQATGKAEPEWHTVQWQARRYDGDNFQQNQQVTERLGPRPFQLVAFRDGVRNLFLGPPTGDPFLEPRRYDRLVKFPSGELPSAYCAEPTVGGGIGNILPMSGFVDEVEVVAHLASDLLLTESIDVDARTFRVDRSHFLNSAGAVATQSDLASAFPTGGGLVAIDTEILAYQSHADGTFAVATNGRGLLHSEPRGHDRGARVKFLTHRPAAILAANVGVRDAELQLQSRGAMPERYGTALLGRELLHYAWVRNRGDNALLEMPRWYPPGEDPGSSQSRGLFRGRFGTSPQSGSSGEAVIAFPFRYWDRHVERSDDPELAYFQLTSNEAPVFYRSLRWRQETSDPRVRVLCMVRADSKLPWESEPLPAAGYWHFQAATEEAAGHKLAHQASRLEIRFVTTYQPGCLDLETFRAHGWKTTARLKDVRLEYEGEGRVFDEQVTAR